MVVRTLSLSLMLAMSASCLYISDEEHAERLGDSGDTSDSDSDSDSDSEAVDADSDGYGADVDCDDANAAVHPDADELCNEVDDDCDGTTDEQPADGTTYYADADSDGFGDPESGEAACSQPAGRVADGTDCDDSLNTVFPGVAEVCNSIDDDCDGDIDDEDDSLTDAQAWFYDGDDDTFGAGEPTLACDPPSTRHSVVDGDCDDAQSAVNPGADEVCNGVDDDCDGGADVPGTLDVPLYFPDRDGDGFGDPDGVSQGRCDAFAGWVDNDLDCDDDQPMFSPNAFDPPGDGLDQDCSGEDEACDVDGDGFDAVICVAPGSPADDCDDEAPDINPGKAEICDNGVDDDCNQTWHECGLDPFVDLSAESGAFTGISTNGRLYDPVSGFDFNGDGVDDIAIGSAEHQGQHGSWPTVPAYAGAVFIFYGPYQGGPLGEPDVMITSLAAATLPIERRFIGASVAAVPDVDDDGRDEILIGSPNAQGGTGMVWLVRGRASGPGPRQVIDVDDGGASMTLTGPVPIFPGGNAQYAQLGARVGASEDLNGDGAPDIVVGNLYTGDAPNSSIWVINAGYMGEERITDLGFRIDGGSNHRNIGARFDIGDLNMDGKDDLVVGSPIENGFRGCARMVWGPLLPSGSATLGFITSWALCSRDPNDLFGTSVAIGGDIDGDGANDLAVGGLTHRAQWPAAPDSSYDVISLYSGARYRGNQPSTLNPEEAWEFAFLRVRGHDGETRSQGPRALCARGDIDGDGLADVAFGAPYGNVDGALNVFEGYGVLLTSGWIGRQELPFHDLRELPGGDGLIRFHHTASSHPSVPQSAFGLLLHDVDGDGKDDLLLSERQWGANSTRANLGRLHIFPGWAP
jgi:hypothetical protein